MCEELYFCYEGVQTVRPESFASVFIGGALAGFVNTTCIYPMDTIKTRLQSSHGFKRAGGFKGIYRGFRVLAGGALLINGVFFSTYETVKKELEPYVTPAQVPWMHVCTASFARLVSLLIRVPIELVKQRQQMADKVVLSAFTIWATAYRNEGILGLYRGFASTCIRDVPFSFIEMPVWELLKTSLSTYTDTPKLSVVQSAGCGLVAGGVAGVLTTPFDVAKTRIVLENVRGKSAIADIRLRIILAKIYSEKGLRGLFTGATPRVAMVMTGGFIFYIVYEITKDIINQVQH